MSWRNRSNGVTRLRDDKKSGNAVRLRDESRSASVTSLCDDTRSNSAIGLYDHKRNKSVTRLRDDARSESATEGHSGKISKSATRFRDATRSDFATRLHGDKISKSFENLRDATRSDSATRLHGNNKPSNTTRTHHQNNIPKCVRRHAVAHKVRQVGFRKLQEWNRINNSDVLLLDMIASRESLLDLLNCEILKVDLVFELLKIFAKVSQARRSQMKISALSLLRGSKFLSFHLSKSMLICGVTGVETSTIVENLINLMEVYFLTFPSSYNDVPLDALQTFAFQTDEPSYKDKIGKLFKIRLEIVEVSIKQQNGIFVEEPPSEDFRKLDTFPNEEDIHRKNEPYLRKIRSSGCYEDGNHYLDIQFRLLREDLVAPLKNGICEIINGIPNKEKIYALKIYDSVKVQYPSCTRDGLIYRVCFNTNGNKMVNLKRKLIFGSLLCLSKDRFQTMVFATVSNHDDNLLLNGMLDVRFIGGLEVQSYFRNGELMEMVESPAFFEAYKHVLEGLKECDPENIPMSQYIVHCNLQVEAPLFVRQSQELLFNLSSALCDDEPNANEVKILVEESWPSYKETTLNEAQFQALKYSLSKEFVVIQGPPGTGKTHVGLRIADALLSNKQRWNESGERPMLVVCYTNHALDQFIGGLVKFGHKNVVRVGGRFCEEMKEYSLYNAIGKLRKDKEYLKIEGIVKSCYSENRSYIEKIEQFTEYLRSSYQGKLVNFSLLQQSMSWKHAEIMKKVEKQLQKDVSVIEVFLNIARFNETQNTVCNTQIDAKDVENREDDEEEEKQEGGIKIEEERDILIDRWVSNKDEFTVIETKQRKKETILQNKIQKEMRKHGKMSEEEANNTSNPWHLKISDRWRLYLYWINVQCNAIYKEMQPEIKRYEDVCLQIKELKQKHDEMAMRKSDVIAMTTTCSARYRNVLENIQPKIVVIEEAAEVLEAHILTSLSTGVEHLVLIGDHQQLKPNPEVYHLAKNYNLEVSLFERMVNNKMICHTLNIQHRMRPEISKLLRHIYPMLQDHPSVENYPNILGISQNVMLINHHEREDGNRFKTNAHEASFLKGLCNYFLQQGYKPNQVTILTAYSGQLLELKNIMPKSKFKDVRVATVDNFQGEENDIILLSLVRSNSIDSVGFLKITNRICVAMSRAKHGLFVIGNFDLLYRNSDLWKEIICDAKEMGSYSDHVLLHCQNHPKTSFLARTEADFNNAPEGGCREPCEYRLPCGHVCRMKCHVIDPEHTEYICKQNCVMTCYNNHVCMSKCHFGNKCEPCRALVKKIIPSCHHAQLIACHVNLNNVECESVCGKILTKCGHACKERCIMACDPEMCEEIIEKTLPCSHQQICFCSEDVENVKCRTKLQKQLPCGHFEETFCFENVDELKCYNKVEKMLKCDHKKLVNCSTDVAVIICKLKVKKKLLCGHVQELYCCQDVTNVICSVLLSQRLKCGHTQDIFCSADTSAIRCQIEVKKKLRCGHSQTLLCSQDTSDVNCKRETLKKLPCSHEKIAFCHQDHLNIKCDIKLKLELKCGHIKFITCGADTSDIVCQQKCTKILDCSHPCRGKCGSCQNGLLNRRCKAVCKRLLPCSHTCEGKCTDDCPCCLKPCENRCVHGRCTKKCAEKCNPCMEKCTWQCAHLKCTKRCSEKCDRKPCDEPCKKLLKCKHNCIGLCGETCPKLCMVCDNKTYKAGARFIELEDCGHCFEVEMLDAWMHKDEKCESQVRLKECPDCKTCIRKNLRYGNIIKETLKDISMLKAGTNKDYANDLENKRAMVYGMCKDVDQVIGRIKEESRSLYLQKCDTAFRFALKLESMIDVEMKLNSAETFAFRLARINISATELSMIHNQVVILAELWKLREENNIENSREKSYIEVNFSSKLEVFIKKNRLNVSQLSEAYNYLQRIQLYFNVELCLFELEKSSNSLTDESMGKILNEVKNELISENKIEKYRFDEITSKIKIIADTVGVIWYVLTAMEKILPNEGEWFKCTKGHFYLANKSVRDSRCSLCDIKG